MPTATVTRYTTPSDANNANANYNPFTGQYSVPQGNVVGSGVNSLPTDTAQPAQVPNAGVMNFDQFTQQRGGNIDENAVREQTRRQMQAQIDATDKYYADLVARENEAGNARLDKVRALNVNSGLGGSTFATTADLTQRDKNATAVKSIEAEKQMKIEAINGNIDAMAREAIAAKKAEALGNAEAYSKYLETARGQAQGQLQQLAASGADLSNLDPQRKAALFQLAGYDPQFGDLLYNAMKPKPKQIDYKFEKLADGQGMFYGTDPSTGELKQIKVKVDLPPDSTLVMAPDGTPLIFNKTAGTATVAPGFSQGQFAKPETPKQSIVKINGVDYQVDENGNFTTPNVPTETQKATELKTNALNAAKTLLQEFKDNGGSAAVGTSRLFGLQYLPGSKSKAFQVKLDNLKSLLSLDSVKFLKGQGQVSDAERRLLEQASSKLDPGLSEGDFKKALEDVVTGLSGTATTPPPTDGGGIIEYNGKRYQTDQNGNFDPNSPLTSVGADTNQGSKGVGMMRTDRHNNPAAFTTDIAKLAGLKEGVDYTVGDPFSGGKYHTARLLGDPVDTTIKVIDRIGFYTQSGKPRWTYVSDIPQAKTWNNLSYDQKKNVVAQMYAHEGGSQLRKYFA